MELAAAIVGAIALVVGAVITRLPGFTADDRRRGRILRDAELWKALPDSPAREELKAHMEEATTALLAERERRVREWLLQAAMTSSFVAALALVGSAFTPRLDEPWGSAVQVVLIVLILGCLAFLVAAALVVLLGSAIKLWRWMKKKRRGRSSVAAAGPEAVAEPAE